jgi:hypothetical protein
MNNQAPLTESAGDNWSASWAEWFTQVWSGLSGWKRTWNKAVTYDFANVPANSQITGTTATITGVRSGDAVLVTPASDTAGIIFTGVVTANDTVTLYAKNFTMAGVDPPSKAFRIIVFQN